MINIITDETGTEFKESVICDICNCADNYSDDILDAQEYLHIAFTAGYGSIFGDGNVVECDICQHCIKDRLGAFLRIEDSHERSRKHPYYDKDIATQHPYLG